MLCNDDEFKRFTELQEFKQVSYIVRRSLSIILATKRSPKMDYNEDLKYGELCVHPFGKNFKTASASERPNQK